MLVQDFAFFIYLEIQIKKQNMNFANKNLAIKNTVVI